MSKIGIEAGAQFDTSSADLVLQTGAEWVRFNFIFDQNNPDPDFNYAQPIIDKYVQNGIRVLGLIGAESVDGGYNVTVPGNDFNKYLDFLAKYVDVADKITALFGDRVKHFEFFNEPNDYNGGNESQVHPNWYTVFHQFLHDRIRGNGRNDLMLITGPLLSHDLSQNIENDSGANYLRQVYEFGFANYGWSPGNTPINEIGVHFYVAQGSTDPNRINQALSDNINALDRVLQVFDPDKNLSVSEIGWQNNIAGLSQFDQANNLEIAANFLKGSNKISRALWFDLKDFFGKSYGLLDINNSPKKSWYRFLQIAP